MMESQIEQNLKLSFSYVKKDLMRVNEQIESLNEKIQHISMNHASLLDELVKIEKKIVAKKQPAKKKAKKAKKEKTAKVVKVVKKASSKAKPVKKIVKETETVTYS